MKRQEPGTSTIPSSRMMTQGEGVYLVQRKINPAIPKSTQLLPHLIALKYLKPIAPMDHKGHIVAPIKTGQHLQGTTAEIEERFAYDRKLLSYRQTAEWGMRSIQGSFGHLCLPLQIDNKEECANLLEIRFCLHNLRTWRVGYNEIQKVYMPEWRKTLDDEEIWTSFESMVFGDQRRKDCVSRFHVHPRY